MQNREEKIAQLLGHYLEVAWTKAGVRFDDDNRREVRELAGLIATVDPIGQRGNGGCICTATPAWQEQSAKRMGFESWLDEAKKGRAGVAQLDHRCPEHGERAQPRLWGRHKTLVLEVSAKEWNSLGVTYPEKPVVTDYQEERF